jgi:predicted aspartyl protease
LPRTALALFAALLCHQAQAACTGSPAATLPLTLANDKLLVPVGLNGSPEWLALDTGAGITVISTEAAGRLNIPHDFDHAAEIGGVGGANSVIFIGLLDTMDLAGIRLSHQAFPIVDLPMRAGGQPVSGFLGADVLHNFNVDLDLPRGEMKLWPTRACNDDTPPWQDDTQPIAFDLDSGNHILVPFKVDGVNLTGVLDTGAYGFSLTTRAAYRAGVTDDLLENDVRIRGTGVNNRTWEGHRHHFEHVVFGGAAFPNVQADIIPSTGVAAYDSLLGADALLGVPFLEHARLWISYRARMLYVLREGRE